MNASTAYCSSKQIFTCRILGVIPATYLAMTGATAHYGGAMTTPCAVQRCPREGTWPVRLKEAGEEIAAGRKSATFIAVPACKEHRDLLMSKSVEWILEIGKDPLNPKWHQQTLLLGETSVLSTSSSCKTHHWSRSDRTYTPEPSAT